MGTMLVIGMGPRKAGEGKTSPASSNEDQMNEGMDKGGEMKMPKGMVMLPVSMLEVTDGSENVGPSEGDHVELSGVVHMVKNGVAHIKVNDAMMEGESDNNQQDNMSEEDKMRKLAQSADEESYS
jgi:hypothetical protein